ncbi:MAG TPA: glycosyltransferase family 4 protein, partial [Actinomycetota bacterium]|nr:glycosyltransferase family 4 protein [Actinomycetota bacterium]
TTVIYGGADTDRYRPDPVGQRDGVLFVGRITPHKGVDRLIAALPAGARLRRTPTVVTDHGLGRGGWGGAALPLFDRFLLVSEFSARELGAPPERTRVVHGGVDVARFRPDPPERRDGVLFVGRITPHKGLERLLAALPAGATLRIAGSEGHDPRPPERDYPALVRRLASGRDVQFLGPVPDDELPALYRRAEVFVLPSVSRTCYGKEVRISELLGLSVLEAMASGTPVVCSRIGGVPEVVRDGETGFVVTPGDIDELRERLWQVLADRALAERLGRNGREWVVERFTWDACARRCLEAYEALLG